LLVSLPGDENLIDSFSGEAEFIDLQAPFLVVSQIFFNRSKFLSVSLYIPFFPPNHLCANENHLGVGFSKR